jgi:hypothetical protein
MNFRGEECGYTDNCRPAGVKLMHGFCLQLEKTYTYGAA